MTEPRRRIGILADSHGRAEVTAEAVRLLTGAGATELLHLGDIETEAVLEALLGLPVRLVFGNCDHDHRLLGRHAERLGFAVDHPAGRLDVGGRRIAYTHGDRADLIRALLAESPDYLLTGHTHRPHDERAEGTRLVNPGALFRASRYTVALLDPAEDRLDLLEIPRPANG